MRLVPLALVIVVATAGCSRGIVNGRPPTAEPSTTPVATRPASPTPGATTTPAAQDTVLASLWSQISDPGLSYHLSGTGSTTINGETGYRFTMELDISGDDYAGRINSIGGSGKSQIIRKDGMMYARPAGSKDWISRRYSAPGIRMAPFLGIDSINDLVAHGTARHHGRDLLEYTSTDGYRPDVTRMLDLSRLDAPCSLIRLDLLVTEEAVPTSAKFRCEVESRGFAGVADYTVTALGHHFSIEAP